MDDQDIAAAEENNDSTGGESENKSETPPINERSNVIILYCYSQTYLDYASDLSINTVKHLPL